MYDPRILELLISSARIKPSILQNRWHHSTGHDVSLLSHLSPALSSGPSITYQPFWTLTGNPLLLSSPSVAQIAQRRDWTKEQVVYRFVTLGMGVPGLETALLSGTSDGKHVQQAADVPQLDPLEEMELEALGMEVYGE